MARPPVDLVAQHPHHPGAPQDQSFEDRLRELLHDSPYLGVSAVLHVVLMLLFASAPEQQLDPDQPIIRVSSPDVDEPPPPPPPPPKPPEIDKPDDVTDDPVPVDQPVDVPTPDDVAVLEPSDADLPDVGDPGVIGLGGGDLGGPPGGTPGKLRGRGTTSPLDITTKLALEWLARHQSPEGHWSAANFDVMCEEQQDGLRCDGTGNPQYDVGVTGLSLLAFLGAGNTPTRGKYKANVRRGLRFLVENQDASGNFGIASHAQHTYDHAIATIAMIEAYDLTLHDLKLKAPAERALDYLYSIRNPGGAWRYAEFHNEMKNHRNDVSVTGWAILAMSLARDAGLPVDEAAWEDSLLFLDEMTDPRTGVTGYVTKGGRPARDAGAEAAWPADESESMTAVALLCRIFADPEMEREGNAERVAKGAELIRRLLPVWSDEDPGRRDFYYWYYGAYAAFQVGDETWKRWEGALKPALQDSQIAEGEMRGSWDPQGDPWGAVGGRVYSTAMLALCTEVYYRYGSVMGAH